ncbi:MAG: type II secretion system F family protein [Candidatus Micrarchaeota archaeon]|nr:type II secretion system F family protein [Candidatus Micrarchaeota archaeon]
MKEIEQIFSNFSFYSFYSKKPELEEFYKKAHLELSFKAFYNFYFSLSFGLSFLIFLLTALFSADLAFSFGLFSIFFALFLLFGYRIPKLLAKWRAKQFEQDLPAVLRAISLYLQIGMNMEKIFFTIANSNYSCSPIFKKLIEQINLGSSVPQALAKIERYVYSMHFSRAAHSLLLCYEKGTTPENLESLADDLSSLAQTEIKQQSSRLALFSLVFVVLSSVLPAFYLIIFVAAGPLFGLEGAGTESIFLFYLVILPILISLVLVFMLLLTPPATAPILYDKVFNQANKILTEKFPLFKNRYLVGLALAIFGIGLSLVLGLKTQSLFVGLFLFSIPFLVQAYFESNILAQINELEEQIANMLLAGAAEKKFSLERMLEDAKTSPAKLLAKEANEVLLQINAGANPVEVLKKWQESTPSLLLVRSLKLILVGYVSGGNMQKALKSAAEDILSAFNLARERGALISLQTYTLLASSAFLVPIILSLSISFAYQLVDLSLPSDLAVFSKENQIKLIETSLLVIPIYLFINSALVAFAVSNFQNSKQKFVFYFIIIAAISEVIWFVLPSLTF